AVVTAMQVIPKAQGLEVVSCSANDTILQCVSVSTDEIINSWNFIFLILLVALIAFGFILLGYLCWQTRQVRDVIDESTQTDGYNEMTNEELNVVIGHRLNNMSFPLSLDRDVTLRDNYHLRLEYKSAGALYDGTIRRWHIRAGSDLRALLDEHHAWF
ncbi:MAG: hypothetical protein ACKPKO_16505, partial [Candidatus Fonsibacter sp.]